MKIQEITQFNEPLSLQLRNIYNEKDKSKNKVKELITRLAESGWALEDSGHYSMVFLNEQKNAVLKVNRIRDRAYEHFVDVCKKFPNKHFPKITDRIHITQGWYAYLIERLYPLNNPRMNICVAE